MTKTTGEQWKTIKTFKNHDYLGKYEVSNYGRVRNARNKKDLGTFTKAEGSKYKKVALYDKDIKRMNVYVHQLVAFYFLEPPTQDGLEIDHIDGDANNNRFENLRYVTHTENMRSYTSLKRRAS